jgi:CCR4-NOT transcription complex subunit 9
LGVIGALVKVDDPEIVHFLLQTEIIPLSLRIMETGTELSKTVATFIVQKILLDDNGLQHICSTAERFYAVTSVLANMVTKLIEAPSARLLKHIVRCYLRLSENPKAREPLRGCLPETLKDQTFANAISQEDSVQRWLQTLLKNLSGDATPQPATGAATTPAAPGAMTPSGPPPGVTLPSTASASATAGNGPPPALTKPIGLPTAKAWGANA